MIARYLMIYLAIIFSCKNCLPSSSADACLRNENCNIDSKNSSINAYKDGRLYMNRSCFCDEDCYRFGDCCAEKLSALSNRSHKDNRNFKCVLEQRVCQSNKPALFVYSVGDCSIKYAYDNSIRKKCEKSNKLEKQQFRTANNSDIFLQWPFYSNQTKTTYNNIYCGLCNGEKREHLQPWHAAFRCDPSENQKLKNLSARSKMDEVKSNCVFVKWMSDYMHYRYCRKDLISKCLKSNDSLDNIKCAKGNLLFLTEI